MNHVVRPKKKKSKVVDPTTLGYDELVDEAVDAEDRGDRYKSGDKAYRFYTKAIDLYILAHTQNGNDVDVIFNICRVYFILSDFEDPAPTTAQRREYLEKSEAGFRRLLETPAGKTPDSVFMLSQVLRSRAEDTEDDREAIKLLEEVSLMLEFVFDAQKAEMERDNIVQTGADEAMEEDDEGMDVMSSDEGDEGAFETAVVGERVTTETLIETLSEHLQALNALLSLDSQEPYYHKAISLLSTSSLLSTPPPVEMNLRFAEIITTRIQNSNDMSLAMEALSRLDLVLATNSSHVEALSDKGDLLWAMGEKAVTVIEARDLWAKSAIAYASAFNNSSNSSVIALSLGAANLGRSKLYPADMEKTRNILFSNASIYYSKAIDLLNSKPHKTTRLAEGYLGFARATSFIIGREKDCQKALALWRESQPMPQGGWEKIQTDENGIEFSASVRSCSWFEDFVKLL